MVHQGVSVKNAFAHLDDVEVMVSQRHTVPKQASVPWLCGLSVSVLADDVLHCVELQPAMVGVDDDLLSSDLTLFLSVH